MSAPGKTRDLTIEDGRCAFGADAANYDSARPEYPSRVFDLLAERCGLAAGTRTFEVGPGTGLATRRLLGRGAEPLIAIEPDARLVARLAERAPAATVLNTTFEDAELPACTFDLGTAATSFHWIDQRSGLAKVADLLRPGGWWAMWWNVFGDSERPDAFHDATETLLSGLANSPSWNPGWRHPFGVDREARFADLAGTGHFEELGQEILRWTLVLDPVQVRALYATYSQFSVLDEAERNRLLDALQDIAAKTFSGRVERNMLTPIYTARRT